MYYCKSCQSLLTATCKLKICPACGSNEIDECHRDSEVEASLNRVKLAVWDEIMRLTKPITDKDILVCKH